MIKGSDSAPNRRRPLQKSAAEVEQFPSLTRRREAPIEKLPQSISSLDDLRRGMLAADDNTMWNMSLVSSSVKCRRDYGKPPFDLMMFVSAEWNVSVVGKMIRWVSCSDAELLGQLVFPQHLALPLHRVGPEVWL